VALHEIKHLPNQVSLAIWKIEEADEFFLDLLSLSGHELTSISKMKGRRKTEWLASRWLWRILAKDLDHGPIVKDKHGKPCIKGSSWQMSISHTHDHAAVIAAPFLVGIDIQRKVAKINRIAHKFLSTQELEQVDLSANPLDHLHVYWGAKESLYKAYGRRKLDFKDQLQIKAFNLEAGFTLGSLLKGGKKDFKIWYELTHEFVLVYATEIL
jgi:4'-phosphopantetheinyl transferase EntD